MWHIRSTTRLLYPYSLSYLVTQPVTIRLRWWTWPYQATSFTNWGLSEMQALPSTMEDRLSVMKSVDTTWSSVYARMPLKRSVAAASCIAFLMSSSEAYRNTIHKSHKVPWTKLVLPVCRSSQLRTHQEWALWRPFQLVSCNVIWCALNRSITQAPYPLRSGITLPTALAAPVDAGMMFWAAVRPSRQF